MVVKSYKDLVVWQMSMEIVENTYRLTTDFPRNEEFGLKTQMRRAAVSIPSNIAEGQTRLHRENSSNFSTWQWTDWWSSRHRLRFPGDSTCSPLSKQTNSSKCVGASGKCSTHS
jgi:hypothetical protein